MSVVFYEETGRLFMKGGYQKRILTENASNPEVDILLYSEGYLNQNVEEASKCEIMYIRGTGY